MTCLTVFRQSGAPILQKKERISQGASVAIHVSETKLDHESVLKVDGHLKADDVAELTGAYRSILGNSVLDLSELQSADSAGLETLRELVSLGAEIRYASPYITLLLKTKP